MKSANRIYITAVAITLLAMPICLAAEVNQEHHKGRLRYRVVDLGTLGGTFSDALSTSNKGWVAGFAAGPRDASIHAFLRREGAKTDLGTFGGPNSTPNIFMTSSSVSRKGEIVGAAESSVADPLGEDFCFFGTHLICLPFLWQDGVMTQLATLGGNNGAAFQINDRGQAVGEAENTTHDSTCNPPQVLQFKPVIWEEGNIQELPTFAGDPDGIAFAINDRGQAVGVSADCSLTPGHALLWQNGKATDMGTLGGLALAPSDLNNRAQVVGNAFNNTRNRAFLWQSGMAKDLGTLRGDVMGHGNAINDKGQVVGQSCDVNNNCRAFIWQHGVMTDLNSLVSSGSGLYLVDPQDINAHGEIVGGAVQKRTNAFHAFLAIPCDRDHANAEGCKDRDESATAGTHASQAAHVASSRIVVPSRVRESYRNHNAGHAPDPVN
jgi:probable HAF family extracellular repeat protein